MTNVMCVTGAIFGIIGGLTSQYEQKKATESTYDPGFFFSLIKQLRDLRYIPAEAEIQPTTEPVWQILIKTLTSGVSDCKNAELILARYSHFQSLKHLEVASLAWLTAIWECFATHCIEPTGEIYQHMLPKALGEENTKPFSTDSMVAIGLLNYLANIIVPNRLFITSNRYMGLAPSIARSGDMVAIFNGCAMPYVVRSAEMVKHEGEEVKGALQVIRPCYLHGIMKGEVFQKRDSPQFAHLEWTRREPDPVDSLDGWLMLI